MYDNHLEEIENLTYMLSNTGLEELKAPTHYVVSLCVYHTHTHTQCPGKSTVE